MPCSCSACSAAGRNHQTRPTKLGLWAITAAPMTPAEVANLIHRTRIAMVSAAGGCHRRVVTRPAPRSTLPTTTRARCAARYAHLVSCSLRDAANVFGLRDLEWPRLAWQRMHPAESPVRHRGVAEIVLPSAVPQFPPGALCGLCAEFAVGALHREPLGRDGGLVNVCVSCSTEMPREGRYSFGASSGGLGNGNRRVGSGGPR